MTSTYKTASQFNRAAGALAGQFVGDAFGAQYEFSAPMGHVSDKIIGSPAFGTAPGQITDDGELAIELILSMLSRSGKPKVYQTSDAEANYKRWYKSKPFDMGRTTSMALCENSPQPDKKSQANGALMRISPLGVYASAQEHWESYWYLSDARSDAAITHPNAACTACNQVFTRALVYAIRTGDKKDAFMEAKSCALKIGLASAVCDKIATADSAGTKDMDGVRGWVVFALINALHQMMTADSVKEAIINTVKLGGDTDTNAAIAGALAGAIHGFDSFPKDWIKTVQECDTTKGCQPRSYQNAIRDIKGLTARLIEC